MGFVDTVIMAGRLCCHFTTAASPSQLHLASRHFVWYSRLTAGLTPVIAQLNGSGRRERIAHQVHWASGGLRSRAGDDRPVARRISSAEHNIDPAPV